MPRIPERDQVAALLRHARGASPFTSNDGQPCASVGNSIDSRHVHPLRSAHFRDWLTNNFFNEFETAPSPTAYRSALRVLEARARHGEFPPEKLDHRVGFEGDPHLPSRILLDLANSAGDVLEIDSHGWRVRDNLRHAFRESITTLPLPRPIPPSDDNPSANPDALHRFAQLFSFTTADRARIFTWLMAALRPTGPYPILVLHGPAGSGKTFLARALRALIDPSPALIRRLPDRAEDLLTLAFENWTLAFDDAYRFSSKISDALCAISSGDALRISQPDSRDALEFEVARPIVVVAPHDETKTAWTPHHSLSHRTIMIQRTALKRLYPEAALWSELESLRPSILAALAQATATALRRVRDIDLPAVTRFPDAAVWAAAAAPALGINDLSIIAAINDPAATWIGADPLRDALRSLIAPDAVWTGDATALLNQLRLIAPRAELPSTPKGLSQALPAIRGFRVERARTLQGGRELVISRIADEQEATAGRMN
jgi:hypothetical protein